MFGFKRSHAPSPEDALARVAKKNIINDKQLQVEWLRAMTPSTRYEAFSTLQRADQLELFSLLSKSSNKKIETSALSKSSSPKAMEIEENTASPDVHSDSNTSIDESPKKSVDWKCLAQEVHKILRKTKQDYVLYYETDLDKWDGDINQLKGNYKFIERFHNAVGKITELAALLKHYTLQTQFYIYLVDEIQFGLAEGIQTVDVEGEFEQFNEYKTGRAKVCKVEKT